MKKQLSDYAPQQAEPEQPGAFMPDGSFKQDGGWVHQGPAHALVVALVRKRRSGSLTPPEAAAIVRNANGAAAFPWVGQWETCSLWPLAWTATSAEETVKRAGNGGCGTRGEGAHWCSGGRWADGTEASCSDPGHRPVQSREQVSSLVATIQRGLGAP